MSFENDFEAILEERDKAIWEGVILNVNTLVSNSIGIPEGEYQVVLKDANTCRLISTNEASKQQVFEVTRPTLTGFFNPEVHRKVIIKTDGKFIAESVIREDLEGWRNDGGWLVAVDPNHDEIDKLVDFMRNDTGKWKATTVDGAYEFRNRLTDTIIKVMGDEVSTNSEHGRELVDSFGPGESSAKIEPEVK